MIHYFKTVARHWSQSRSRTAIQDQFVTYGPLLTAAGLTTLALWSAARFTARRAPQT